MSKYYIKTKNKKGMYVAHEVPEPVYLYVRQLEMYVKYPEESKLKEVYSERFSSKRDKFSDIEDSPGGYRINYTFEINE